MSSTNGSNKYFFHFYCDLTNGLITLSTKTHILTIHTLLWYISTWIIFYKYLISILLSYMKLRYQTTEFYLHSEVRYSNYDKLQIMSIYWFGCFEVQMFAEEEAIEPSHQWLTFTCRNLIKQNQLNFILIRESNFFTEIHYYPAFNAFLYIIFYIILFTLVVYECFFLN